VACGQSTVPATLSGALRTHLQGERFAIVTSIRGLPLGVREDLQRLFVTGTLDIAEPGAQFQRAGLAVNPQLPLRQLIAAGCSADFHCLVYYERGGTTRTWHVMLFHWTPDATRLEWGGIAAGGLATIDDVQKAILSGVIKAHTGPW
jgi:hypothetical protein